MEVGPTFSYPRVQSAALWECVRAPTLPICTPATLIPALTVATGVGSAVQNLDNILVGDRLCPTPHIMDDSHQ